MSTTKVAIVTGSNKGIGYAIVRGLCEKYPGVVYLTARDEGRGKAAVAKLKELGLSPLFHQLDITDQTSIDQFKNYIKTKHGGIDLLINNAAIYFNNSPEPFSKQAEETLKINYFGTINLCDALFPLLRKNAKVVNMSSLAGHLKFIPSPDLKAKFRDPNLTVAGINTLMKEYLRDANDGTHQEKGWAMGPYFVSKVGLSAATIAQQKEFNKEVPNRNISANHVNPGYVATDLNNHMGPLTVEQGAKAPLYLALEADNLKGEFVWEDCTLVDWYGDTTP